MIIATLLAAALMAPVPKMMIQPLNTEDLTALRASVYAEELAIEFSGIGFGPLISVPESIKNAYCKNSTETLKILLKISEGGNPTDSVKAVCYALEVCVGQHSSGLIALSFNSDEWDKYDKNWKVTPRDHWIAYIKEKTTKQ